MSPLHCPTAVLQISQDITITYCSGWIPLFNRILKICSKFIKGNNLQRKKHISEKHSRCRRKGNYQRRSSTTTNVERIHIGKLVINCNLYRNLRWQTLADLRIRLTHHNIKLGIASCSFITISVYSFALMYLL